MMINDVEQASRYIFSGNSVFTLKSRKSNDHITFKVKRKNYAEDVFYVSVLSTTSVYIGYVSCNRFSGSKSVSRDVQEKFSKEIYVFKWLLRELGRESLHESLEIWHDGKCGRCRRTLTHPDSISSGLGPECIKYVCK